MIIKGELLSLLATSAFVFLLAVGPGRGSLLSTSLQFTRDALMGFSHGSQRSVEILTPKKTKRIITPFEQVREMLKGRLSKQAKSGHGFLPKLTIPTKNITREEITYTKESRTYKPRLSPSNKFLEAINDIERAVAKAKASGFRYRKETFNKLKGLLARAIRSKSYKYAREVLGKIMYLLSTKSSAPRRSKRTTSGNKTTPETEGGNFLQDLRKKLGASVFDSFMAVQGDVSLMFAIDNTGSMREEIQAAKNIAIDIINYPRNSSVKKYILSPFNDPYPGTYKTFYFCVMFVSLLAFFNLGRGVWRILGA